jgi:hypothetical protein
MNHHDPDPAGAPQRDSAGRPTQPHPDTPPGPLAALTAPAAPGSRPLLLIACTPAGGTLAGWRMDAHSPGGLVRQVAEIMSSGEVSAAAAGLTSLNPARYQVTDLGDPGGGVLGRLTATLDAVDAVLAREHAVPAVRRLGGTCDNCGLPNRDHCAVHQVPHCPGRCPDEPHPAEVTFTFPHGTQVTVPRTVDVSGIDGPLAGFTVDDTDVTTRLVHAPCQGKVCDIDDGDEMDTLARMCLDHAAACPGGAS